MKNRYLIAIVLVTLPMILGQANAGEKELSKDQVPKAAKKAHPKDEIKEAEKINEARWDDYRLRGRDQNSG
jgi:hypothetical protein